MSHRPRRHYPQGRAAELRTSLGSPSFAVRKAAWITAQTRSLVDEFITGARTIDRPWAHDQLSSGRMGHLRVRQKLAVRVETHQI